MVTANNYGECPIENVLLKNDTFLLYVESL